MSEEVKQTYHCDRCGEVFKSSIKPVADQRCTACGMPPVRTRFAQLTDMPALDKAALDLDHGVAGKDAADFVSMQRKTKQRRAAIMYAGWIVLLLVIGGVGYYVKEGKKNKQEEKTLLSRSSWQFQEREKRAAQLCAETFGRFATISSANSRALYMVDGTDYLLDMRRFYANPLNNITRYELAKMTEYRLEDSDGRQRLDAKFEIREGKILQKFEAVFWKQDEKWLLDWAQFVRIGEMNIVEFIQDITIEVPQRFRLYVRVPDTGSTVVGYTDLIVAHPLNDMTKSYELPLNVLVKDNTQLKQDILKHIETNLRRDRDNDQILGDLDPSFMTRAQLTIGHEKINGVDRLVLVELNQKNWLAIPQKK